MVNEISSSLAPQNSTRSAPARHRAWIALPLGLLTLAICLWAFVPVSEHLQTARWYFWRPSALVVSLTSLGAAWVLYKHRFPSLFNMLGPVLALCAVLLFFVAAEFAVAWWRAGHSLGSLPSMLLDFDGRFWTSQNGRTIVVQSSTVAVAALGMTLIIIAGGIDLSVGNAIALAAVVIAVSVNFGHGYAAKHDLGNWPALVMTLAIFVALATGCAAGAVNGLLVSWLRIVPFIITLGTMTLYLGLAKIFAGETTVRPRLDVIPLWVTDLVDQRADRAWLYLPRGAWIVLALSVVLAAVLRYTVFGRHVFAIGSNEATARLCGINVGLTKVLVYTIGGLFAGIAGVYQFARLSSGNPTSGGGMELKVIAAVVIGGGSLSGGRGSVLGTLAGAAIMLVIASGCTLLGLSNPVQDIIIGVIIVAAVALDRWRQRGG